MTYRQDHRIVCRICEYRGGKGPASLTSHIKKVHSLERQEYYDKYVRSGEEGTCLNCGNPSSWQERMFCYSHCCSHSCHTQHLHKTDENYQKVTRENISKRNTENWKKRSYRKKMKASLQKARDKYHADPKSIEVARNNINKLRKDRGFEKKRKKTQLEGMKKYWSNSENREAASIRASKRLRDFDDEFGFWSVLHKPTGIRMRSYYELKFADMCLSRRIPFKYEPETFKLENGRRYTPDFYLTRRGMWVEIKIKSSNSVQVQEKRRKFNDLTGKELVVLTPKMFLEFFKSIGKL